MKKLIISIALLGFLTGYLNAREREEDKTAEEKIKQQQVQNSLQLQEKQRKAVALMLSKDFQGALEILLELDDLMPNYFVTLYNTACVYSRLGEKKLAIDYLKKAVESKNFGVSVEHIEKDQDLNAIKNEKDFKLIIHRLKSVIEKDPEKIKERIKEILGEFSKEFLIRDLDKFIIVSNLKEEELEDVIQKVKIIKDMLKINIFKSDIEYYTVIFILADPADLDKVKQFSADFGNYDPLSRTLVINLREGLNTLIHGIVNTLHYNDMGNDLHAMWIIKGLASLYEYCEIDDDKLIAVEDYNIQTLKNALGTSSYIPMRDLITGGERSFIQNPKIAEIEARYIMYFLQQKNLLNDFYIEYKKDYQKDATGMKILKQLFIGSIDDIEQKWIEFIKSIGRNPSLQGIPYLGIMFIDSDNLIVRNAVPEGPAEKAGIKAEDRVISIDNVQVASLKEIIDELRKHKIGDKVKLQIEREDEIIEIEITTVERR